MSQKILKASKKYQAICLKSNCGYISNNYTSKEKAAEKGYNHMLENEGHVVKLKIADTSFENLS